MGVTLDPPGIHDLYGGLQEIMIGALRPYSPYPGGFMGVPTCMAPAPVTIDGEWLGDAVRGAAWYQSRRDHDYFALAATRGSIPLRRSGAIKVANGGRSPRIGIRCMRWVNEPR